MRQGGLSIIYTNDTGRGVDTMYLADRLRLGARALPGRFL